MVDGVLDGLAHQTLGPFARDRLDAQRRGLREAQFLDTHLARQQLDQFLHFRGAGLPFDAGVDVFGVLAEDHHVGLLGLLQRRGHAFEIAHRTQADIEVQLLAHGHVQGTDAAPDRRGQRPLDRDQILLEHVQCLLGQPGIGTVELGRLLARIDFHPVDLARTAVGLLHRSIDHLEHHRRDIHAHTITHDEGNDGIVRDIEGVIGIGGDLAPFCRHLDMLVRHRGLRRLRR